MKSLSPLLGYLGRAGTKVNTPEDGDTKISVPGVMYPCISLVHPTFQLIDTPLPGGASTVINSFMYSEEVLFNVNTSPVLLQLGPGLWEIETSLHMRESGAVSDVTSTMRLTFFDQSTGATVVLHRITNKQAVDQSYQSRFRVLVMAEQPLSFNRITVAGAGTGLNNGCLKIIGSRLF